MANYTVHNRLGGAQQNLTTTFKTQINIVGAATFRARMWGLMVGADGAPNATDCQIVYDIASKDATTPGTAGGAATPNKTNPADRAAGLTVNTNYTAEPTTFTSVLAIALNQRASQRWVAFDANQTIVMAATASLGLAVRALSPTYASLALASIEYEEL